VLGWSPRSGNSYDPSVLEREKTDLSNAIKSIDGNINHAAKNALLEAEKETNKKVEADKKKAEADKKKLDGKKKLDEEEVPAWAQTMMEQNQEMAEHNQKLAEKIGNFEKSKTTSGRLEKLTETLKDVPEYYSKPILASFNSMTFADDTKFDEYEIEVKTAKESFMQTAKENGIVVAPPSKDLSSTLDWPSFYKV